ncbi:P-loop containing nucleoside triphosphate hydrolase protein [Myxozyma melibiosi]|uniref:ATP-dependent RNA helicase n=1 Tax=Myxozyma melibiosi TaxID=54550 RepID=A0ABR1EYD5_9ASCO
MIRTLTRASRRLPASSPKAATAFCSPPSIMSPSLPIPLSSCMSRMNSTDAYSEPEVTDMKASKEYEKFEDLTQLDPLIVRGLTEHMGFTKMTDVQRKVLPYLLNPRTAGSDAVVQSHTGTGKTVAFLTPIIQEVYAQNKAKRDTRHKVARPQVVIITPARELAFQIKTEVEKICHVIAAEDKLACPRVSAVTGGVSAKLKYDEIYGSKTKGCDIIVATPGRLADDMSQYQDMFRFVRTKVYDEADSLLDRGFEKTMKEINTLLNGVANVKQTLMFSATIREDVINIAKNEMGKNFLVLRTSGEEALPAYKRIPQTVIHVKRIGDQMEPLVSLLQQRAEEVVKDPSKGYKAIVFMRTGLEVKHYSAVVHEILKEVNPMMTVTKMLSRMSQSNRLRNLEEFKRAKSAVLLSTDVLARGIDISKVTEVFQIGMASDFETYVHRTGRTGRAGNDGAGTVILSHRERSFFLDLVKNGVNFTQKLVYNTDPALAEYINNIAKEVVLKDQRIHKNKIISTRRRGQSQLEQGGLDIASTITSLVGYYSSRLKLPDQIGKLKFLKELIESAGETLGAEQGTMLDISKSTQKSLLKSLRLRPDEVRPFMTPRENSFVSTGSNGKY